MRNRTNESCIAGDGIFRIATPVGRINTLRHITMTGGMWPSRFLLYQAMFQGIHVHIIHVPSIVGIVTDEMLPINNDVAKYTVHVHVVRLLAGSLKIHF